MNSGTAAKILVGQNALVVLLTVLLRHRGDPHALINALFVGGLPFFLYGLWQIVCRLGLFEVAAFSYRRLRAVDAESRGDETSPDEAKNLLEDRQKRPKSPIRLEFLVIGGLYVLVSILLSFGA